MTQRIIHDQQAELCLLALIYQARRLPPEAADIERAAFTLPVTRDLYSIAIAEHDQGRRPDWHAVEKRLHERDFATARNTIAAVRPDARLASQYVSQIKEAAARRAIVAKCAHITEAAHQPGMPLMDVMSLLHARDIVTHAAGREPRLLSEVCADVGNMLLQPQEDARTESVFCGLQSLDGFLYGFGRGLCTMIAGEPGTGKSALAMCIAVSAGQTGQHVIMHSIEDTAALTSMRAMAMASQTSYADIRHRRVDADQVRRMVAAIGDIPVWIDDKPRQTVEEIRMHAIAHRAKHGRLDFLIIDHLGELSDDGDPYKSTSKAVRAVRDIAKELDCAVILLVQLNRNRAHRADPRPRVTDLRDSGKIEEVARCIMLLYRDRENAPNIIECDVAKNSHGKAGVLQLNCDLSKMLVW